MRVVTRVVVKGRGLSWVCGGRLASGWPVVGEWLTIGSNFTSPDITELA